MAFGDALRQTDGATVVLNVDTSQTAKLERAEAQWRESVGTMSREALKLDLAQQRLKKSLASYGAESAQAKRATIALKDAEEQAARAADRQTRETDQLNRSLGRATRGALAGSGAFRNFGRMIAFASGSFLGGAGFVYAARRALDASSGLAEQQDFANRMFGQGIDVVTRYANTALGLARDQAFEATAGLGALLVKFTDSQDEAARLSVTLTKLGVDLASIKDTGVDEALTALRSGLVGETEPLRRFAVLLNAAAVEQEALRQTGKESAAQLTEGEKVLARVNIILREAAYAQGNYADTIDSTANQEREAQKNLRNTAILIGDTLQPAYRDLLGRVNDYLGSAENQAEVQRRVNEAVEVGETVVRGFAGGLRIVKGALDPFVRSVGGAESAVKLLVAAFAVSKAIAFAGALVRMAAAIRAMGLAAVTTRTQMLALAATPVGGVPVAGGRGVPVPGRVGVVGTAGVIAAGILLGGVGQPPSLREQQRRVSDVARVDPQAGLRLARDFNREFGTPLGDLLDHNPFGASGLTVPNRDPVGSRGDRDRPGMGRAVPPPEGGARGRGGSSGLGGPTLEGLLLDVARPGNERADLQALRAFYARQIKALESKKSLTKAQKEKLRSLYGEIASVQSQIDALEQEARDRDEERERRREEAKRKAAERLDRILDAAEKTAERRGELFEGIASRSGSRAGLRALALRGVDKTLADLRKEQDAKTLTEEEMRRAVRAAIHDALRDSNAMREFGSNFFADGGIGQVATQSYVQTHELREQSRQLGLLVRGQWHPGAWYAGNELAVAGTGVGY